MPSASATGARFRAVKTDNPRRRMTTLAHIAASFGLEPAKLAATVGMGDVGVDTPLTLQQIAFALDAADNNPFVGPNQPGRHRLTR